MLLVKSITLKKTKTLQSNCKTLLVFLTAFFMLCKFNGSAQDNSPYSRYGLGDIVPQTNIISRGMGGVSAGYSNVVSINFQNPASYAFFQSLKEAKSKKLASGRVVLDLGTNFENRTLKEKTVADKFVAYNALFSHLQLGIPLRNNWGLSFGLRPLTRISYKIDRVEMLYDPITHQPIDSALTEYRGDGGSYLASMGTGYKFNDKLSAGFNFGYLFGKKEYHTQRAFLNDTITYQQSNYETKTSYGNIYFNAGIQYRTQLNKQVSLTTGAYGNLSQKLNAWEDIIRETFLKDPVLGDVRLDSIFEQKNIKGKITYPASFGLGFIAEKPAETKKRGWQLGMDFTQTSWSQYRYYGATDSIRNNWQLHFGAQSMPAMNPTTKSYWNVVTYRAGFFIGSDYIKVKNKLPQFGASFGISLPLRTSRFNPNEFNMINLAIEYGKRGNNNNLLRENLFRVSVGFSFSDFWFVKRKYD